MTDSTSKKGTEFFCRGCGGKFYSFETFPDCPYCSPSPFTSPNEVPDLRPSGSRTRDRALVRATPTPTIDSAELSRVVEDEAADPLARRLAATALEVLAMLPTSTGSLAGLATAKWLAQHPESADPPLEKLLEELGTWEQLCSLANADDREKRGGMDACKRKRNDAFQAVTEYVQKLREENARLREQSAGDLKLAGEINTARNSIVANQLTPEEAARAYATLNQYMGEPEDEVWWRMLAKLRALISVS